MCATPSSTGQFEPWFLLEDLAKWSVAYIDDNYSIPRTYTSVVVSIPEPTHVDGYPKVR